MIEINLYDTSVEPPLLIKSIRYYNEEWDRTVYLGAIAESAIDKEQHI